MGRPTLFVALEGPLLVPDPSPHPQLGAGVAAFARPFLHWARDRFDVQVLTDEGPRKVFALAEHLGLPADAITPRGFEFAKTEVMKPEQEFFWVDSALIPSEISWLGRHQIYHRLLAVDPAVGVAEQHRDLLSRLARSAGNRQAPAVN